MSERDTRERPYSVPPRGYYDFEGPPAEGTIATMVVRLEWVTDPEQCREAFKERSKAGPFFASGKIVRISFESANPGDADEKPITIRHDSPLFHVHGSSCIGFFTFINKSTNKAIPDDSLSNCGHRPFDRGGPIDPREFIELPCTVDQIFTDRYVDRMNRDLGLKDGEEALLRLNSTAIGVTCWTQKSRAELADCKIFEDYAADRAKDFPDDKIEIGLRSHLLHWDISQAYCSVPL